ncbi:hypothetical protein V6N12_019839 [Hibiscus sabdariffa]|uniref:DUF4283 domain-containing protein n=1 Tax=Hibiscus sabdariffa TaxID=183260 RepID=A0ABR2AM05_9ROSI
MRTRKGLYELSISGLPIHAWSETIFKNLADLCGSFIQLDVGTRKPTSFKRGRMLIITDFLHQIDEMVNLNVEGRMFQLRVCEIESVPMRIQGYACENDSPSSESEDDGASNVGNVTEPRQ